METSVISSVKQARSVIFYPTKFCESSSVSKGIVSCFGAGQSLSGMTSDKVFRFYKLEHQHHHYLVILPLRKVCY